jgi:ubiquinone/menaquinone biosynthesis C-methylase UbiE
MPDHHHHHVCPWRMGYFLLNPFRRLRQNPERIVLPYVKKGMEVIEIGPGMGYFSIPMARIVGDEGKIVAVDLQEQMLKVLGKRAQKAGMRQRIELKRAKPDSLCLEGPGGTYDFALAFAVVHELPDQEAFFRELSAALKPEAMILMADPESRFSPEEYERALAMAVKAGFRKIGEPVIWKSRTALLKKNAV